MYKYIIRQLLILYTSAIYAGTNTYVINIDTTALSGSAKGPFALAFYLSDGSGLGDANNTVTISNCDLGGGAASGAATNIGGASGAMTSSITLTDTLYLNAFIQPFVPGVRVSCQVIATTNVDATVADVFTISILDRTSQALASQGSQPFYGPLVALPLDSPNATVQSYSLVPVLTVKRTPISTLTQGQSDAVYSIALRNDGAVSTTGSTTVFDLLPTGFSASAIAGSGWTCVLGTVSCSRTDSLPAGGEFPPISAKVTVSGSSAPASAVNQVNVSGGGSAPSSTNQSLSILPAFSDVLSSDVFLPAINLLREYTITSGCSNSPPKYCASDNITRSQMAVFVVRAVMGGDDFNYTPTAYFTDVPTSHPFFKWVQKMRELGITSGCSGTTYCPDDPVTRGQMAVFIIRARVGASTPFSFSSSPLFTDVTAGNGFFSWIQKMRQLNITSGCSATTYCANDPVTRAQMAVFIMRGAFNQLLPPTTPTLVSVSPSNASPGQVVNVTLTGQNTTFVDGVTQLSAAAGITVSNVSVIDATTLRARLNIDIGTIVGPRSIIAIINSEEASLPNGFAVQ